jgi:hypothetical protein
MALAVFVRPNLVPGAAVLLAGVGLGALWQTLFRRLAALCIGFAPVLFMLWHNWHFGGRLVPIGDNANAPNIWMMPPSVWWSALSDIARLNFGSEDLARAASQAALFLSGPSELRLLIPLHVAAFAIALRVACARRFEPMLQLGALAALALSSLGYVYLVSVRYHLVMWFMLALVAIAWFKTEGLALIERFHPGWRERMARSPIVLRAGHAIARLRAFAGIEGFSAA